MKISKSVTLTEEESEQFLMKYLTKYLEGKLKKKVVSIARNDDGGIYVDFEEEDFEDE